MNMFYLRPFVCSLIASVFILNLQADQVPNPTVTAAARPFNASFNATNLFDPGTAEFASLSQGAVSAPFTTNVSDGTWAEFDFGATVTFNQFVMIARANNADIIGTSRLIVSPDPVFDNSDMIFTFNPSGANGAGFIRNIGPATGRYARWEALTRTGSGLNLGGRQMWFLNTPAGQVVLPAPVAINSSTPFNGTFVASQAVNGNAGDGGGNEYASAGVGASMFVDFDFGSVIAISGFDFWNRPVDRVTTFNLVFANTADFASPIATLPFTASLNGNQVNTATFSAVPARYVRFQATGAIGGVNTGMREIQFYTPSGQPPFITQHPQNATRLAGDTVTLSVTAGGEGPITYQWWKDTSKIDGATSASLTLTNLQVSDTGSYSVVVANNSGSITSGSGMLTVINPAVDIASDLRLWFKLDETTFLVAGDSSGNSHEGVLQGFADDDSQWIPGRLDGALAFRPNIATLNEVVTVVDNAGLLDFAAGAEFSLAAWVRTSAAQEDGAGVIARGSGGGGEQYAIDIFGGTYRFFVRSEAGAAQVAQSPVGGNGSWQHVVAVYSRTLNRMKLYVNKAEMASSTPFSTGLLANSHELSIGARQLSTTDYNLNLNGAVDDVRVYGRALTPSDIAALYDRAPLLAPSVVQEPQATFTGVGGTARFTVGVEGTVPLTYQWRKGGTPIDGATNVSLTITNAQLGDEGNYSVLVINGQGQATSAEAHLTVIPFLNLVGAPVQASSLFNASFPAAGAFDGLKQSTGPNTARWASTSSVGPPHWIYVDLGQERLIRRVAVDWETAGGKDFTLRVRRDAQGASSNPDEWTTVAAVTGYNQTVQGIDGTDVLCDFTQSQILMPGNTSASATTLVNQSVVAARYLMLHVTAVVGAFVHVSVWEIQVDGVPIRARIQPLALGSSGATLNFDGAGGLSYEIQRSTTVIGGWSPLTTIQTSASGAGTYTDPTSPQPNGFYRVVYP